MTSGHRAQIKLRNEITSASPVIQFLHRCLVLTLTFVGFIVLIASRQAPLLRPHLNNRNRDLVLAT